MYISDLISKIKSDGYKIKHFYSADLISDESDHILVIYSYNGINCSLTYYESSAEYGIHRGKVLESGITYKTALNKALQYMKGLNNE